MDDPTVWELAARITLAVGLGTLVGLERESRNKIAGVRTHALVALGSAVFAIAGAYALTDRDATRVAAQVVSGIGFIGAGAIVRSGGSVTGITTAATLWVAAALGMVAAFGLYGVAVTSGVLTLVVVAAFGRLTPMLLWRRRHHFELTYRAGFGTLAPLFGLVSEAGGQVKDMQMSEEDGVRTLQASIAGTTRSLFERALETMAERDEVLAIRLDRAIGAVARCRFA